ncbi:hypothetical protein FACS1894201_03850 [Bacteroidia bacterium]|nr:hypothetical protein FACS1894201_03850 [Bacteroidia bacterium]
MKTKHLFLILAIATIVVSCTRHCEFPEQLKNYVPYSVGDIITFVNQNNETLVLSVKVMDFSEDRNERTGLGAKSYCNYNSAFEAMDERNDFFIKCFISGDKFPGYCSILLYMNGFHKNMNVGIPAKKMEDSLVMDNHPDNIKGDKYIDRVKLVKGKGITEIHYSDGTTWKIK